MNYNITIDELVEGFLREDIIVHCPTKEDLRVIKKELKNRNIILADYCSKDNWNKNKENTCLAYINVGEEYFIENVENFEESAVLDFNKYTNGSNVVENNYLEKERLLDLLKYSQEAIDYWFNGCGDSPKECINKNEKFKDEVKYFIGKLSK